MVQDSNTSSQKLAGDMPTSRRTLLTLFKLTGTASQSRAVKAPTTDTVGCSKGVRAPRLPPKPQYRTQWKKKKGKKKKKNKREKKNAALAQSTESWEEF